jgi:membrane protein DedA with SNARE-associated domain
MSDRFTEILDNAVGSPWVYVALFLFAMTDAFFPIVPSETLVISAGVFAAGGDPNLVGIIVCAAAGAFVGDHISYFIGRFAGDRWLRDAGAQTRRKKLVTKGKQLLDERGAPIIIACRYIPGARTAVTLTAGATRFALAKFSPFDAVAAITWATYSALIGYLGGNAFEEQPLKGLGLGLGIALGVSLLVEVIRHQRAKRVTA